MFCKRLNEKCQQTSRRNLLRLTASIIVGVAFCGLAGCSETQLRQTDAAGHPDSIAQLLKDPGLQLMGNRFFTFNTVVRVNQIETSRDAVHGEDESSIHSPKEARAFREAVEKGWPGARITWAFSWLALKDERPNYRDLKKLVVAYHKKYGDEITFIPGGYFANMYNTRQQVNRDLHDGLQMVSDMVGAGYRPQSVIAGFLSAENLRFLAEEEGIHVCQGNIWSQYAIDNGDGDGSISYPYYPSREHFCKPAQGKEDFIDCVNLDGWTIDFLNATYPGGRTINGQWCGSRQGVGPIETVIRLGTEQGTKEMLATTAAHFDKGFELNDFAWVTCIWELCLVEGRKIYGYKGRNGLDGLLIWLSEMRRRWPEAKCITQGEFGMLWRKQFKNNDNLNYRFVQRGSGICGSDPDMEIRWFMNKDFRLALLRNWQENTPEKLIDFTRYDLKAAEPTDPEPGEHIRNWSLINRLNQKGIRPQDKPIPIGQLNADEQAMIKRRYPELLNEVKQQINYKPFIWRSYPPDDCQFEKSTDIVGIRFTGKCNDLHINGAPVGDTWYFSWASDDKLYSPFTDGAVWRLDGGRDHSRSWKYPHSTGQAIAEGDDPITLKIYSLGLTYSAPDPYSGRYPCASLVYNDVWYYGTYCLSPEGFTYFGGELYNWPWLGPFVGFRISTDFGRTWKDCPHTPDKPLFNETGMYGYPVKIGAPHFVDFGKNMEHSPDGYAYLVGHGAEYPDKEPRFANLSWISGDQIYLIRVKPSIENINDASKYEFFSGYDKSSNPVWTSKFDSIKPLIDWNNNCGCVNMTYNASLKKYLMCITDGWPTAGKMNSYILESDNVTGPWKLVVYMKHFGQQGYFLNFPSKFISENGRKAWLCYSANYFSSYRNEVIEADPPGSHYGLVLQEIELLSKEMYERHIDDLR